MASLTTVRVYTGEARRYTIVAKKWEVVQLLIADAEKHGMIPKDRTGWSIDEEFYDEEAGEFSLDLNRIAFKEKEGWKGVEKGDG